MLVTKHIPVVVLLFSIIFKTIYPARTATFTFQYRFKCIFSGINNELPISKRCAYPFILEEPVEVVEKSFSNTTTHRATSSCHPCNPSPGAMCICTVSNVELRRYQYGIVPRPMWSCTVTNVKLCRDQYGIVPAPMRNCTVTNAPLHHDQCGLAPNQMQVDSVPDVKRSCNRCGKTLLPLMELRNL